MAPNIGDPKLWAAFGLEGLIIFTLFAVLISGVIFVVKRFDTIDARNRKALEDMAKNHYHERNEWRENSNKQIDKFEHAITRLTDSIRDRKD